MKKYLEFWIMLSTSLVGILIGITSSATGLKDCVINAGTEKYKSINKKRKTMIK